LEEIVAPDPDEGEGVAVDDETDGSGGASSTGFAFGTDESTPASNGTGGPGRTHFRAIAPAHHMSRTTDNATHGAIASA
jgi:hypothetical protein